jgi:hypothetical protein
MNVKQEPPPFIINCEAEILLELDNLSLTANETALLTPPNEIL